MRWFKAAGGLLAIVLLMSSCIKVDGSITIEDDGSGSVEFLSALNTEVLTSVLGDFDVPETELGDTNELCDGFSADLGGTEDLPAGATVTPYEEDGFCGSFTEFSLAPSFDHSADIAGLFEEQALLYKEGDNWFFEAGLDVDDITSEASAAPEAIMEALFEDASLRIVLDLPGKAVEGANNATEVLPDGKFVWDVDIFNAPPQLIAQTEPGSGGGSGGGISPILIGVLIAGLLGAAALFLFMRQRKGGAPTPAATSIEGTTPAQGPSSFAPVSTTQAAAGAAASEPPLSDGPPISAAPVAAAPVAAAVTPATMPIVPDPQAVQETVVMDLAETQRRAQEAAAQASQQAREAAVVAGQEAHDAAAQAQQQAQAVAAQAHASPETAAEPAAATQPAATQSAATQPVYDETLQAWTFEDPIRGRLRHDPATDSWNPV